MKKAHLKHRQLDIAYEDVGTGDAFLLLHAFPFDREMWQPQLQDMSNSCRLIAPDFPGFGASSPAKEAITIDSLADIMVEFLDAIGLSGPAIVAGLSMGGNVAIA